VGTSMDMVVGTCACVSWFMLRGFCSCDGTSRRKKWLFVDVFPTQKDRKRYTLNMLRAEVGLVARAKLPKGR